MVDKEQPPPFYKGGNSKTQPWLRRKLEKGEKETGQKEGAQSHANTTHHSL